MTGGRSPEPAEPAGCAASRGQPAAAGSRLMCIAQAADRQILHRRKGGRRDVQPIACDFGLRSSVTAAGRLGHSISWPAATNRSMAPASGGRPTGSCRRSSVCGRPGRRHPRRRCRESAQHCRASWAAGSTSQRAGWGGPASGQVSERLLARRAGGGSAGSAARLVWTQHQATTHRRAMSVAAAKAAQHKAVAGQQQKRLVRRHAQLSEARPPGASSAR